jgi:hypothetical protein
MLAILIYIIKSTLYLTLLYAFFLGVMRKTPFFRLNRWMLVVGTVVCMLLPFYSVSVEETGMVQMPMQSLNDFLAETSVHSSVSEEVVVSAPLMDNAATETENISFFTILSFLYMAGAVVCCWLTCRSISRMQKLIDAFLPMWKDGFWLVVVPDSIASFSWNRHMVISEEDYRHHPSVIIHEEAHLRKHHSWDLMLFSFVSIVHWFNPLVWIAKRELQQLHEYEADREVIRQGMDATEYQLLLVKKAVGPKLYSMANSFNQDKLKNRIFMMHQEKTNSWGRLKWLMVVPVVVGAMYLFAQPEEIKEMGSLAEYQTYFQEAIRKQDLSKVETGNVHSFNIGYDNRIMFKEKEIASVKDIKRALAPMMEWIRTSSDKEMHCLGVSYESATDEKLLCSYLQEIKEAYEEENLTPLVFINAPSVTDAKGVKRYYGIEISFPDKKARPLRNFTIEELKDAVKQASSDLANEDYVKIGFRATKDMKMQNVNEVRRILKELYHPQNVIFRQSVMKE